MKILAILLALFCLLADVQADDFNIIAIANDISISNYDVVERTELLLRTSGIPVNQQSMEQMAPQALQMLINEALQKQDAEQKNINVTDRDVQMAIAELEQKNKLPPGGFDQFVKEQGIQKHALINQLTQQILWRKLVQRQLLPKIILSDLEVQDSMAQFSNSEDANTREVFLSEIVLDIPKGKDTEVRELAENLVKEIRIRERFSEIARQFSISNTSEDGGVIGWVPENRLHPSIKTQVKNAQNNTLLPPIHDEDVYRIIRVGNRRVPESGKITEKKVRDYLMLQKLDLESKRYLRELRDNAFIEVRF